MPYLPSQFVVLLVIYLTGTSYLLSSELKFSDVKKLYDNNRYEDCLEQCGKQIRALENTKPLPIKKLSLFYELKTDCLIRKNFKIGVRELNQFLCNYKTQMPSEIRAALMLKLGNSYRNAGFYSKALDIYKQVISEFKQEFPTRFASYAKENMEKLLAQKAADIKGVVSPILPDITVKAFNGFEETETKADNKGNFQLPLFASTPGTQFMVIITADKYYPFLVSFTYKGGKSIDLNKVNLELLPPGKGIIKGAVYLTSSGGRRRKRHGIALFPEAKKLLLTDEKTGETIMLKTDKNGFFEQLLEPGKYSLKAGIVTETITITPGAVVIRKFALPVMMID